MNRRQFIRSGAGAMAAAAILKPGRRLFADPLADMKKRVGVIGTGWYGKCDVFRLIQVAPVEVVSLCDVDSRMLDEAADLVARRQLSKQRPRTYSDYRELLAEKDLDIVIVGTPDHWHALQTIAAIEAGADVYCQKPTSVDVAESHAMLAAARQHERVVQIGTQRRSTPHLVEAREDIIGAGKLGHIGHVDIYCYYHMRNRSNPPEIDPPDHLDFDLWTGPAPMRPFNELIHPRGWRAFMEYGNGIVGDMCIHMLDMVRWMLDLGMPKRITSSGGIYVQTDSIANTTDTQNVLFDYGDLTVSWQHRTYGDPPDPKYPWGATIYGDRGTLKAGVMGYDFIPRGDGEAVSREVGYELEEYPEDQDEDRLEKHVAPAIRHHMRDFMLRIADRGKPVADIEEGHISTIACILANVSQDIGRSITWDHDNGRVIDDDQANALLARPYREPWQHPAQA